MGVTTLKAGTTIATCGQSARNIYIITKGSVTALFHTDDLYMTKGDVIGLIELGLGYYSYQYVAETEVTLLAYPCSDYRELHKILEINPEIAGLLSSSLTKSICHIMDYYIMTRFNTDNLYRFLIESYKTYKELCIKYSVSAKELPAIDSLVPLKEEDDIPSWVFSYYESFKELDAALSKKLFVEHPDFLIGCLMKASADAQTVFEAVQVLEDYQSDIATVLLNSNQLDLFDLYTSLLFRVQKSGLDTMSLNALISTLMIQMEGRSSIDPALYNARTNEYREKLSGAVASQEASTGTSSAAVTLNSKLAHSLDVILKYAGCLPETADTFRQAVYEYRDIMDKTAVNDFMSELRKKITTLFYEIYTSAFQVSLLDPEVPTILKMFFLFGYVDEGLAGIENANYLYEKAESFHGSPRDHIYTLYEWLRLIYEGGKEPSRNEFDNDYTQYIHELRLTGKITDEIEKKMAQDKAQKVMYELQNMFPLVNRITHGKIATYCPVFSEHNLLKAPEDQLVSPAQIAKSIQTIRAIDYSAFYRETLFSDTDSGIPKETILTEVLPDLILMPNIGLRGVMWQEIEGKRRTTPSRMMLPILYADDTTTLLLRLVGEFRWEMCKRVQGARWNDVSDPSLTSEYFDYIQFYRKNSDLSPDVRDKIKLQLQKTKGSYKEAFVRDYVAWVTLEGKGSPVLNKVSRKIMFAYCPFSKVIRATLGNNPLYKEYLDRYEIKTGQKMHHLANLYKKLTNSGHQIPPEILMQQEMLNC